MLTNSEKTYMTKAIRILEQEEPMSLVLASSYQLLSSSLFNHEEYHEASVYYEKTARIYEVQLPQSNVLAFVYYSLGNVSSLKRCQDDARQWYVKALEIENIDALNPSLVAEINARLANFSFDDDDGSQSQQYYETALVMASRMIEPGQPNLAAVYNLLGFYVQKQGNRQLAHSYFEKALKLDELHGNVCATAEDYHDLGLVSYEMGQHKEAQKWYKQALNICASITTEMQPFFWTVLAFVSANCYFGMGRILEDEGDYEGSLAHHQKAVDLFEQFGSDRIESILGFDPRPLPTLALMQKKVMQNPFRCFSLNLDPAVWCHVFSKYQNEPQSVYYMLREQPHLFEVTFH